MYRNNLNYQALDDRKLLELTKSNNDDAFEEIVSRHYSKLYQVAMNILKSHSDTEEVVWSALKKAYQALPHFRGDSQMLTWLCRITINQSYNKLNWNNCRGSKVNVSLSSFLESDSNNQESKELDIADYNHTPTNKINNQELGALIVEKINALPDTVKETMTLRFLQNMPYNEIAARQHCEIGTIKSRISRGRKILLEYFTANRIYPSM